MRMNRTSLSQVVGAATTALLLGSHAQADVVIPFSGRFTSVSSTLGPTLQVDDTIVGTWTYDIDPAAPDVFPADPNRNLRGILGHADFVISTASGGPLAFAIGGPGALDDGSGNLFGPSNPESVELSLGPSAGAQIAGRDIVSMTLDFQGGGFDDILTSDALPVALDRLAQFPTMEFRMTWASGPLTAVFASGVFTVVPEPTSFALMLGAFGALGEWNRRRRRPR